MEIFSIASLPMVVYPAYATVFMQLSSRQQLWFSLLLPVMKQTLRSAQLKAIAKRYMDASSVMTTSAPMLHILFTIACVQHSKASSMMVLVLLWSPLAFGILTGKYSQGIPEGARLNNAYIKSLVPDFDGRVAKVDKLKTEKLKVVASQLGISLPQLAIAWCLANENVSSVICGASSVAQLEQNLQAAQFMLLITPQVKQQIDELVQFQPTLPVKPHAITFVRKRHLA